jgi:uncharacterized protein (TIGR03435 family)
MLLVAKNGLKFLDTVLTPTQLDAVARQGLNPVKGGIMVNATTLRRFINVLSQFAGRIVLDGIKGDYSFRLDRTPDDGPAQPLKDTDGEATPSSSGPTLFAAPQEQLGLKLESQKSPVDILVVDPYRKAFRELSLYANTLTDCVRS